MLRNPFNHIDLRVRSFTEVTDFYRAFLPAIGFEKGWGDDDWKGYSAEGKFPELPFFGFTEDPDHRANSNRVAFWVATPAEVDRIGAIVREAGAINMEGPCLNPEYSPDYYAVFFEDPSGNRFEVVHRLT
jgi:catechol 2,3-dioxygenase-like lactoylglutathione lyase family enzyme